MTSARRCRISFPTSPNREQVTEKMVSSTSAFISPIPCLLVRRVVRPPLPRLCRVVSLSSVDNSDPDTTLKRLLSLQKAVLKRRKSLNASKSTDRDDPEKGNPTRADPDSSLESNLPSTSDLSLKKTEPTEPSPHPTAPRTLNSNVVDRSTPPLPTVRPLSANSIRSPDSSSPSTFSTTPPSASFSSFVPRPSIENSLNPKRNSPSPLSQRESQILPLQAHLSTQTPHDRVHDGPSPHATVSRYKVCFPWKWKEETERKPRDPVDELMPLLASFQTDVNVERTNFLFPRASVLPPLPTFYRDKPTEVLDSSLAVDRPAGVENLNLAPAESILSGLNNEQREAVVADPSKACLVLAGPGSGKTRVLTHRIAFLIHAHKVPPASILSVTFTNKAAGEMKSRVSRLLKEFESDTPTDSDTIYDRLSVGTFHWVCARLLRTYGSHVEIPNDFQICDTDDSRVVLSRTMKKESSNGNAPESRIVNILLSLISKLKNDKSRELKERLTNSRFKEVVSWRGLYDKDLRAMNMLDFDDLLVETRRLLQECPDVREQLQDRYRYVLVDEWQDTNTVQFDIVALLAGKMNNLFVVGDVDQSIYKFRGADSGNIQRYMESYNHANNVVLSINYRSTVNIINAAKEVIDQNSNRPEKNTVTINVEGEKVKLLGVQSEWEEAQFVMNSIKKLVRNSQVESLSKCAVMYRTNAQSRLLEEACLLGNIPYVLQSGIRFFERREVKDLLSYLKVLHNPEDDSALIRILNVPPRGIGKRTLELIEMYADRKGISLMHAIDEMMADDASNDAVIEELNIREATLKRVKAFHNVISELRHEAKNILESSAEPQQSEPGHVGDVFLAIVESTNYFTFLSSEDSAENHAKSLDRVANVKELVRAASRFNELPAFLQRAALMSGPLSEDVGQNSGAVWLSTLHGSKGLEFDAVYITGLEDGIVPLLRDGTIEDIEEERRLLYVGMTRAKRFLTMTWRRNRSSGKKSASDSIPTKLSRFLIDINSVDKKLHIAKMAIKKKSYPQRMRRNPLERDNFEI